MRLNSLFSKFFKAQAGSNIADLRPRCPMCDRNLHRVSNRYVCSGCRMPIVYACAFGKVSQ